MSYINKTLSEIVPLKITKIEDGHVEYFENIEKFCEKYSIQKSKAMASLISHRPCNIDGEKFKIEKTKEFYMLCAIKRDITCKMMKSVFSKRDFIRHFSKLTFPELKKFKEAKQIPYRFTNMNRQRILDNLYDICLRDISNAWHNYGFKISYESNAVFLLKASCVNKSMLSEYLYRNKLKDSGKSVSMKYKILNIDVIL